MACFALSRAVGGLVLSSGRTLVLPYCVGYLPGRPQPGWSFPEKAGLIRVLFRFQVARETSGHSPDCHLTAPQILKVPPADRIRTDRTRGDARLNGVPAVCRLCWQEDLQFNLPRRPPSTSRIPPGDLIT